MVHILIKEMEHYAKEYNVPIMLEDGIEFLTEYIKNNKVTSILEIGSAIGYSAIKMALVNEDIRVTTIERDVDRYNEAVSNINKAELNNRINIILGDALETEITGKYDFIFIDAAKSQYIKFFTKYSENLNDDGVIVSDNLHFHGLVEDKIKKVNRNTRQLVRKIGEYVEFLKDNENYKTEFFDCGDGIAISKKSK